MKKSGSNFGIVSEGMIFLTDKKDTYPGSATDYAQYAVAKKGGKAKVYECYIRISNPLVLDSQRSYDPISYYDRHSVKIYDCYFKGEYDGIIVRDSTKKNSDSMLVVLDNAAQIKSATDNIGTFSKSEDIRYSMKDPISDEIERERNFNYSEGESAKTDANVNRNKVYIKQDAQRIVSTVLSGYLKKGRNCDLFYIIRSSGFVPKAS